MLLSATAGGVRAEAGPSPTADGVAVATVPGAAAPAPSAPVAEDATWDTLFPNQTEANHTLRLLGSDVEPGTTARLIWSPATTFDGRESPRAVLVANGSSPGPVMCLTGVVHGDEHNGLEIVRRVFYSLDPARLIGAVIGIPIVNVDGFRRGSRYLPDRRDLNRYFPGRRNGSSASRIAYSLFNDVISHCSFLVDVHTGSFHRTNLPQLRADLTDLDVLELSRRFGSTVILHNKGGSGTLRRAASEAGIPAVTLETGEPLRIQDKEVRQGTRAIHNALAALNMYKRNTLWREPPPVYYQSRWVRVNGGGVLLSDVRLGARVDVGDRLGTVTDPITNEVSDVLSPFNGRVLGMALNQVVLAGYAAFHIGIEAAQIDPMEGADAPEPAVEPARSTDPGAPSDAADRDLENSE
jgi:predicted deacylase